MLTRAAAVAAPPALERPFASKARKVAQIRIGNEEDVSATTTVAPVGAAFRNVLLAPKAQRAVAAAPRLHMNAGAVAEHRPYSVTDEASLAMPFKRSRGFAGRPLAPIAGVTGSRNVAEDRN